MPSIELFIHNPRLLSNIRLDLLVEVLIDDDELSFVSTVFIFHLARAHRVALTSSFEDLFSVLFAQLDGVGIAVSDELLGLLVLHIELRPAIIINK